ncbi:MAG TPA: hypothetical protein VNG90_04210, partial [Candidatus Acidoferrum sp.]|nr:hypothetical protein [Candidatus Acidoferrum sp.]
TERTDRPGYVTSQHTIRWCEDRGVDVQELHDFFTVSRACYHHLRRELPTPGTLKPVTKTQIQLFVDLIIETQSLQLIESSSASPVAQGALAGGKFEYVLGALRFVNLNADQPELVQFEGTVIGRERIMANLATRQTNLHYADFSSNTIPIELSDVFAGKPFGAPVRMKVPIQQVEPNWMSVLIRQLAEHVARGDTKLAGLDEIVNANKAQHERVSRINASVGRTLLPMTDLVTFYERVLWAHGILVLQELQDFSAFAMKPLDESRLKTQLEKLGRPETICIGGCSFRVRYNPEKGEAIVRIPFQNFSLEVLRAIPDALVFPGLTLQMAVYLFENHAAYYHSDLVALKRSVADYLAHKRWEATTRPNLQLPTQVTIGMVPPPVCEVAYGDDALTGEPQKKFGTWSIKSSYSSDRTAFSETWCNTQEEAEALREAVIEEIAIRQPELLRYAAYEARREHARAVQAQLADSLCGKARYYASSFRESRFDEWLPEGERLLAEESTWLEQYVRAQAVSDLADAALRQPAIYNALDDAAYQTLEAIALDETTRRRDIRLQEMSLEAITSWNIESFTALASFVPKDRFGDLWEEFKLA